MRTTLVIDDDVLHVARLIAARDQRSLGEVISTLARQGLSETATTGYGQRNGLLLLSWRQGVVVTPELVNRLRD